MCQRAFARGRAWGQGYILYTYFHIIHVASGRTHMCRRCQFSLTYKAVPSLPQDLVTVDLEGNVVVLVVIAGISQVREHLSE